MTNFGGREGAGPPRGYGGMAGNILGRMPDIGGRGLLPTGQESVPQSGVNPSGIPPGIAGPIRPWNLGPAGQSGMNPSGINPVPPGITGPSRGLLPTGQESALQSGMNPPEMVPDRGGYAYGNDNRPEMIPGHAYGRPETVPGHAYAYGHDNRPEMVLIGVAASVALHGEVVRR